MTDDITDFWDILLETFLEDVGILPNPFYYKKPNSTLGRPPKKQTTSIPEIKNNIIDEIIFSLQKLKVDNTEFY